MARLPPPEEALDGAVGGVIGVERRGKQSVGVPEAATTGLREADGGRKKRSRKKRRHRNGKKKKVYPAEGASSFSPNTTTGSEAITRKGPRQPISLEGSPDFMKSHSVSTEHQLQSQQPRSKGSNESGKKRRKNTRMRGGMVSQADSKMSKAPSFEAGQHSHITTESSYSVDTTGTPHQQLQQRKPLPRDLSWPPFKTEAHTLCKKLFSSAHSWANRKELIATQQSLTAPQDQQGNTALHLAFKHHYPLTETLEALNLLAQLPPTDTCPLDILNGNGESLLHLAVGADQLKLVQYLLKANANPNSKDREGRTPLHWAAKKGNSEMVKEFLSSEVKSNLNCRDDNGVTPLHYAALSGCADVVKFLLASEAKSDVISKNKFGWPPLHFAAMAGHAEVAKVLLDSEAHSGLNCGCNRGLTPLHWASLHGHVAVVSLLVAKGADVTVVDKYGQTPRDMAHSAKVVAALTGVSEGENSSAVSTDKAPPDLTVEEDEIPRFSEDDQKSEFESHKPAPPPRDEERVSELKHFCDEVKYLILTFNPNEYQAATTYMKPPSQRFDKSIVYPYPEMVVGIFGESGIKVALVWASQGDKVVEDIKLSCESYRNIEYIIAAGVCYAFSRKDFKFADVLISKQIADFSNTKILKRRDGKLACENRGERREIDPHLERLFCKDLTVPEYFVALGKEDKKERLYKAKAGIIITPSLLVDNKEFCEALHAAEDKAIGGEMEGGKLMSSVFSRCFVNHQLKGVIVVKGVCDYADGFKDKRWQFTAAKAALHYIEEKMRFLSE